MPTPFVETGPLERSAVHTKNPTENNQAERGAGAALLELIESVSRDAPVGCVLMETCRVNNDTGPI
jgi:hypothetical protein